MTTRSRVLLLVGWASAAAALAAFAIVGCSSSTPAGPDHHKDSGASDDAGGSDGSVADDADTSQDSGVIPCLDDRSAAADPDSGDGGFDCAKGADGTCQQSCQDVFTNIKAGIAVEANACILQLQACDGQQTDVVGQCVDKAATKACADPTAAPYCLTLLASCADAGVDMTTGDAGAFKQPDCVKFVTMLNDTGRDAFLSCMTDNNAAGCGDPSTCTNQLRH